MRPTVAFGLVVPGVSACLAPCGLVLIALVSACDKPKDTDALAAATAPLAAGASSRPSPGTDAGVPPAEAHGEHGDHGEQAAKVDREQVDADGVVRRGPPMARGEILPVSVASQQAKALDGKHVTITGTVESVCQPMGCWFVVQGDKPEDKVRISSKGHDIFVPKSAAGMLATVEGDLLVKTLTKETAQHYEDERELKAGETRKTFTADTQELSISVRSLELRKKS